MRAAMARAQFRLVLSEFGVVDMSRVPILAILGSTGCGKSRLAIELARRFSGEIISADSMQMDDLLARGKLPIIVGGTNYYIESLLWQILLPNPENSAARPNDSSRATTDGSNKRSDRNIEEQEDVLSTKKMKIELDRSTNESSEELLKKLAKIDPEMAKRLHPNNKRKIIRSLEVFEQHGVTHSELLKAQRTAGGSGLGGPLRHPNSIILWLRCDRKVLDERLDRRVDAMLESGLVQELLGFHRRYNEQRIESNTSADYTKGIFQSIGFKEFHDYLVLPEEERRREKGQELLKQGISDLKLVTKRYAKKQERWVMNRLLRRSDRQVPPVYSLDCTDLDQWNTNTYEPAVAILDAAFRGLPPLQQPMNELIENKKLSDSSNEESHYCEVCERILIGNFQWNLHLHGMKHKRVLNRKKKLSDSTEAEKRKTEETLAEENETKENR
ncbi:tRNA dimethylallyltransferase isoform X2 [Andrena cerasifolii]|uniref:tRNA dimethylallyltransferase isoform X2 n=1 Tax=Andrena cerasifolii TaxID=2819439 RepID=UPI0040376320